MDYTAFFKRHGLFAVLIRVIRAEKLFLDALQITAVTSVNLNEVAFVDEEGNAHLNASLQRSGLQGVGSGIALDAGLRVNNAEVGLHGHLCIEDGTVGSIRDDLHDVALLHILMSNHEFVVNGNLLEGLLVHEDTSGLVLVEILIGATFDDDVFQFLTDIEAALQYAAVADVLYLDDHNGVTLAWLTVLEIDAHPDATVHANGGAFFNVL